MSYEKLVTELRVVEDFRAAHTSPLTKVAANLRYYVAEASGGTFVVGQRLKRMDTIRDKLGREPKMSLSRMHDVAGCRAILPGQGAADVVLDRLRSQPGWGLLDRTWDYVRHPKPDGYRAKHLVARKDYVLIEIQLRTTVQHAWAELVERLDRSRGFQIKAGRADPRVQQVLMDAGALFAALEAGDLDTDATLDQLRDLLSELDQPMP